MKSSDKYTKPMVKICGITNLEDALYCAHSGAGALGFIFYRKSPRYIEPSKAGFIIRHLPQSVLPVGVFVNEQRSTINEITKQTHIRAIQLSGDESTEDCAQYPVDVWKAFRSDTAAHTEQAKRYSIAAAILEGANDGEYGGSGRLPDFATAVRLKQFYRIILAGGLNPSNLLEAIRKVEPYAVDVNSGVELVPGKKDHLKVKLLFEQLQKLDSTYKQ